ncbi:MAG: glutamate synthase large subunit [Oscillospiraceae bacterium]|nr:glutamate synthase large subunit [Oscillospiraceae bacterium]
MGQQSIINTTPFGDLYDSRFEHDACGIGMLAHIHGAKSHGLVKSAISALEHMNHRGGVGAEENLGDGAGILTQIPDLYFRKVCQPLGMLLPRPGEYGVGMLFLSRDADRRAAAMQAFENITLSQGLRLLGWREVPVQTGHIGVTARKSMPAIYQAFIEKNARIEDEIAFERQLYVIRKQAERQLREPNAADFYACSLSCRTIVYKGMLLGTQVAPLFPDLQDLDYESAIALVHSRFSTNTFPSWERAHPNRYLIHNGEINTIRGNVSRMRARQSHLTTASFGVPIEEVMPIIREDGSDSAMFDNCLEFLTLAGRPLAHSMMMMIPAPWEKHKEMHPDLRAFYEFHSHIMDAWDGPAAMAFTDGVQVGATLDRNGLRPARYIVTCDDMVILTSEAGAVEVPASNIRLADRLQPGKMLLIDTREGKLYSDSAVKYDVSSQQPYRAWIDQLQVKLDNLKDAGLPPEPTLAHEDIMSAYGYTYEQLDKLLRPMAETGQESVGAMGTDAPLAILSDKPQLLYDYFHHQFAQVTNPPIDAIREEIVTSLRVYIGSEGDLLRPSPLSCRQIRLNSPILSDRQLQKLLTIDKTCQDNCEGFKPAVLSITYPVEKEGKGLEEALLKLEQDTEKAFAGGATIIILSDRQADETHAAIPALLAVACVQQYTVNKRERTRMSIVLDSAEPREVHHIALLVGYGVTAMCPYAAIEAVRHMAEEKLISLDADTAEANYIHALEKGLLKMLSKMGISAVQSYRGAQPFEALGLSERLVSRYFPGTASRLGGIGLDGIAHETFERHTSAFKRYNKTLPSGGVYSYRGGSDENETHLLSPDAIHFLQQACWNGDSGAYEKYGKLIEDMPPVTLRQLLTFNETEPVPLDEVEPAESIVKRFKTGAMSYGSISREAHECMARAMNRIGGKSNTGEGGEDEERFNDDRCSKIKQVASGRFGVTSQYLVSAEEIQIKIAQGAKPGEGGQLPGAKVSPPIAKTRHSTPGVGLISPPPHHDIYSIEDLAELIYDLKMANDDCRVSVKLVAEAGVGTIAAGVAKGLADVILISGYDGGTGASPKTSIRHAGLPWELGLAETHQTLIHNNLRSRVTLETDGKLLTGRDVAIAAILGAQEFGFATGPLISMGCMMMRVCNLDSCPMGIATQNEELRRRFIGKPEHVERFMLFIAEDTRRVMASLGVKTLDELLGRTDLLTVKKGGNWKHDSLDFSRMLAAPPEGATDSVSGTLPESGVCCKPRASQTTPPNLRICRGPREGLAPTGIRYNSSFLRLPESQDTITLAPLSRTALAEGKCVRGSLEVHNTDRALGTKLGSMVTRLYGGAGLPDDTIRFDLVGFAGQSLAAWLPRGITFSLEGQANDYVGKGLSGGKLIIKPPKDAAYDPRESILIGNVALYGATGGSAFIAGCAGERFCVRNSGALAIVEGVGDHGCEYMTGGRVIVLGHTGRNFAAGMTGGVAYVFDEQGDFGKRCNMESVALESMDQPEEIVWLRETLTAHRTRTGSAAADVILHNWSKSVPKFVRVMPNEYRKAWRESFTQWIN